MYFSYNEETWNFNFSIIEDNEREKTIDEYMIISDSRLEEISKENGRSLMDNKNSYKAHNLETILILEQKYKERY